MSLRFILGRAGAGKTEACIEQIRERLASCPDGEFVLLTPEQATFAHEKRILAALGAAGGFQVKVLSFRRFVHFVLQETGGGLAPVLDAIGKNMVLRSILERRKEELLAFQRVWDKQGFVGELADRIDEFRAYRISPESLSDCLREGRDMDRPREDLASRLKDLSLLFADYEAFLSQGWLDFSGELSLLCKKLPNWPRLRQISFWLDGFHGFTPAEFEVIRSLLVAGRPVNVTLNLTQAEEGRLLGEDALFYPTWETAEQLRQICREGGFPMESPLYLEEPEKARFKDSPDLARLEKLLAGKARLPQTAGLSLPLPAKASEGQGRGIFLASCGDPRQEVERLAVEIREAAREDNLRYREMAVLLRQPEIYRALIESILPAYDIPFFFDGPKSLRRHPLLRMVRELTQILKDRWTTDTLMAYMKTGFAGLSDHQGFALENYCLAYGVQRMHWESRRPWRFSPAEDGDSTSPDAYIERLRQKLWQPLEAFRKEAREAVSAEGVSAALYRHLIKLKADKLCGRMAEEAGKGGDPEAIQLHRRAWQTLMKLLDQTVSFIQTAEEGDAEARDLPSLLAAVWESGLEAAEMAALPPALDQVTVCSMDRSRSPAVRRAWILGANEGQIPATIKEDTLLDAEDRQWLARRRIYLAPDSRRRLFSESYLIYIAFTRAEGSLHISYARADTQGGSLSPSPLLERLCLWFPGLEAEESEPALIRRLSHPAAGVQLLGMALHQGEGAGAEGWREEAPKDLWRYVFHWFASREAYAPDIRRLKAAVDLAPLGQPLPAALTERLFGRTIRTSVTRLEQYQACPFAHFLAYGLDLEPREEYGIEPPDIGNFIHDSLEMLMEQVRNRGLSLKAVDAQTMKNLVEEVAEKQLTEKSHSIFLTSAWYRRLADNLRRILQSTAEVMAYQEGQGHFLPHAMELSFGFDEPGNAAPVSLDLGQDRQILLRGRIDRIDQAVHPLTGERLIRIVDYKSGFMTLALHEIYHGLKLQLILYMQAALASLSGAKPAGMFYFQVHDPLLPASNAIEAGDAEWRTNKRLKVRAFRGYLLKDRQVAELMDRNFERSLYLPVSTVSSGAFGRNAKLLSEEEFGLLGRYSRTVLNRAGQRIMEGDIALTPYLSGKRSACDYCLYRSVCRFDPGIPGHAYRYLPALTDEAVLEKLATEERGREEGRGRAGS
ncbi:MAG: PD-(D/E)XK nuclease family protein [Clostridiales bacterium]|nr:PD-(D/E)XK nuclease family protein [Clostridiales bacterium]